MWTRRIHSLLRDRPKTEGVAAYQRGSAAISRQIRRDYGHDVPEDRPKPKPRPRPAAWGSKTLTKAEKYATELARYYQRRGIDVDLFDLATAVRREVKVGHKTADEAARRALNRLS